jgi:hypothetical protein
MLMARATPAATVRSGRGGGGPSPLPALLAPAAEQGRGCAADGDKRSRLPDVVEALLCVPVLTPRRVSFRAYVI